MAGLANVISKPEITQSTPYVMTGNGDTSENVASVLNKCL